MGFIRTALAVAKELGEKYSRVPAVQHRDKEWFELLQGLTKIPKKEFGRFDRFNIGDLSEYNAAGAFFHDIEGKGNIKLSDTKIIRSRLEDFLHELTHAKQFNPDLSDINLMKRMITGSNTNVDYFNQPIEVHARRVANLSSVSPEKLNTYFKDTINPGLEWYIERGLEKGKVFSTELEKEVNKVVKPFNKKGWLYSGAPIIPIFSEPKEQENR